MKYYILFLLLIFTASYSQGQKSTDSSYNVTFFDLLANKDKYDKKQINITGFLNVEFEDFALYFNQETEEIGLSEYSLWIGNFDDSCKLTIIRVKGTPIQVLNCKNNLSLENLHHKWVSIQGVFDKGNKGHMGSFAGSITKISQIRDIFIKDFNKRMEIDSLRNKDISKMKSENEKPNTIKKK